MVDRRNFYLERYAWPGPAISSHPQDDLGIVVVIPAYNEKELEKSLDSLGNCTIPPCHVEIIMVVNHPENCEKAIKSQSVATVHMIEDWRDKRQYEHITTHIIKAYDLPDKDAGVGLARKIGMDEAVRRFEAIGNKRGIIACFDADSTCQNNYLIELHEVFKDPSVNSCSAYFEHPLEGPEEKWVYRGIAAYELHLRYYVNALKYTGFPFAYHTIGSCMVVTSETYQKQGGMNKRKAGEDFYFLHKIFPLGGFINLNTTTIFPSPRISERVPFGTGMTMKSISHSKEEPLTSYHWRIFEDLRIFIDEVGNFYKSDAKEIQSILKQLPESVYSFMMKNDLEAQIKRIRCNTRNSASFLKSFYQWFDGFKVLKFVHYSRDNYYSSETIGSQVKQFLEKTGRKINTNDDQNLLIMLRQIDKES